MEVIITSSFILLVLAVIVLILHKMGRLGPIIGFLNRNLTLAKGNRRSITATLAIIFSVVGFLYFFYTPPAASIGPEQPISFSHRLHAGIKSIECQFCHPHVGNSIHPGIPAAEKCLYCHNYIIANHWEIKKEHEYFNSGTPIPWVKANVLPEHVMFNHQRHIQKGFDCKECHDEVREMDRIKGKNFKMGFCIECHRKNDGNLDCWTACHN